MKQEARIVPITSYSKDLWNSVINHPLQSWQWGDFRKKTGVEVLRLGVMNGNALETGWQITFHKISKTRLTVGYFPKGPKVTQVMANALQKIGEKKQAIFIQIEPNVIKNSRTLLSGGHVKPLYLKTLVASHHPLFTKYTFLLDLTKSEDALLSSIHPKVRYNIRLAKKHHVCIQEDNSTQAFNKYLELLKETTERQEFYAHDKSYHTTMWQTLYPAGIARLFTATYNNNTVAAWILFVFKNTLYYPYGVSSINYRRVMAPTLMLWETLIWGKRHKLTTYDLWGALGPSPSKKDPFYGFHEFKERFGANVIEFVGSYDLIINPFLYKGYKIADSLRWGVLRLKKKYL